MQKVAAYLLERREGMERPELRSAEAAVVQEKVVTWLQAKGVKTIETSGAYEAEDQSHATYTTEEAVDGARLWWMMRLDEVTAEGRRFTASISITTTDSCVVVYTTLEAGSKATRINPVPIDPKTPRIIRELLALPGKWFHGPSQLRTLQQIKGFEQGEALVAEITDPERTVPIVVVTGEHGKMALPKLDRALAHDLAGLANVAFLDADATWALTAHLGAGFRCFDGAVRVYWPRFQSTDDPLRHPLWTVARLRSADTDEDGTLDRFRRQIRNMIMRASALSVVRPREIDEIRSASSKRIFAEMKERANSLADFEKIAEVYSADNDKLRAEMMTLEQDIKTLNARLIELEEQKSALLVRAENAEVQARYRETTEPDIAPASDLGTPQDEPPPDPGEIRFYKKKFAAHMHDVMVRTNDCGHNNWQSAPKAEKAKKGVAKLEGGRDDWRTLQHCNTCQGGGMWKVRW